MTGPLRHRVPLVDLSWQHRQISAEIVPQILDVMDRGSFVQGPEVAFFESEFARFCRSPYCVAVGNGTDAIELALRAAGIGAQASVILPANTFVATAEAVVRLGGRPSLVDCDHMGLMDVDQAAAALGGDTRAVIPVHLYGQMTDMTALADAVSGHDAVIIEDAAQAQGAEQKGHGIGHWSLAAATSFYPGKNLGAYGDGGAVLTSDTRIAERIRLLANHGSVSKYEHSELGFNSRLDTIQAVVLRAKLALLADWNRLRREAAFRYHVLLEPLANEGMVELPSVAAHNVHVWHLYVIQIDNRDRVLDRLREAGVDAGIHYPVPVHLQPAFGHLGYLRGTFPRAERASARILSLPIYPGITEQLQDRVVEAVAWAVHH